MPSSKYLVTKIQREGVPGTILRWE